MANGNITTGLVSGGAGLLVGTVAGGLLGRGGFFGEGAGTDHSGITTPGGALSAEAQATLANGGAPSGGAPAASGAIRVPTSLADAKTWAGHNPALAVGIALAIAFVAWKLLK